MSEPHTTLPTLRPQPLRRRAKAWVARWGYALAGAGLMLVTALRFWRPKILHNEGVYLVASRMRVHPEYLAHDWEWSARTVDLGWALNSALSLLWRVTDDPVTVALVARPLLWAFVLYGLGRLAIALRLGPAVFALGGVLFLGDNQALAAGEWIFGGAEQKVLSYGFALLALALLVERRQLPAGLAAGAAFCSHVLVGAWTGVALTVAWLAQPGPKLSRERLPYLVGAAALGLPMLVYAVSYLAGGAGGGEAAGAVKGGLSSAAIAKLIVTGRVPHHADPDVFLNWGRWMKAVSAMAASVILAGRLGPAHARAPVRAYVGFLALLFLSGVVARDFEAFSFLKFLPFRCGDTLLLLLGWMLALNAVFRLVRRPESFGLSARVTTVLLLAMMAGGGFNAFTRALQETARTRRSWASSRGGKKVSGVDRTYRWISKNLPEDAVLLADPCKKDSWLVGRRALVVTYKVSPFNARYAQWFERVRFVNGGRPPKQGTISRTCRQLTPRFAKLDKNRIQQAAQRFGATHYVVNRRRGELSKWKTNRVAGHYIYTIPPPKAPAGGVRTPPSR